MNKKEGHSKINKTYVDQSLQIALVMCLKYFLVLHTQKDNLLAAVSVLATPLLTASRCGFHSQILTFFDFFCC
jgi:hypothetical protein